MCREWKELGGTPSPPRACDRRAPAKSVASFTAEPSRPLNGVVAQQWDTDIPLGNTFVNRHCYIVMSLVDPCWISRKSAEDVSAEFPSDSSMSRSMWKRVKVRRNKAIAINDRKNVGLTMAVLKSVFSRWLDASKCCGKKSEAEEQDEREQLVAYYAFGFFFREFLDTIPDALFHSGGEYSGPKMRKLQTQKWEKLPKTAKLVFGTAPVELTPTATALTKQQAKNQ